MNGGLGAAIIVGLIGGGGVGLLAYLLTPSRPVLSDALARLDEGQARHHTSVLTSEPEPDGWRAAARRVCRVWALRLPMAVPDRDLDLLGWSRERYVLGRVSNTALGAGGGPGLFALLVLAGTPPPIALPAGVMLVGGLIGWVSYARSVHEQAEQARLEMRHALVAYLQQVGLCRSAGSGAAEALSRPAEVLRDGSWPLRRIHQHIERAELAGLQPWDGLRRFGQEVDLDDLTDLSAIAEGAGKDGAAVINTLLARAESLDRELLSQEVAEANRTSGRLGIPGALQVFLIAAWVMYPAVATVVTS